ncbi:MAG: hypothetical protein ACE5DM_00030 [Candidatus Nanoarchaeia archaeon]
MGFFNKNINVFLMIIIVVSVAAYAGSTIYYQETFQNITSESRNVKTQYSACQANLDNTMRRLGKTSEILNATESDIRKYDELYAGKSEELSDTQSDLESTKSDLTQYIDLYGKEKKRANDLSVEVTRLTNEKNALSKENNNLRIQVAGLEDDVSDLQDDLDACEALLP